MADRKKTSAKKSPAHPHPTKKRKTRIVFDVEEFSKRTPKLRTACVTCREYPKVAEVAREFMAIKADPKRGSRMGLRDLHTELSKHFGYPISRDAFMRHIRVCEAELYEQIEQ